MPITLIPKPMFFPDTKTIEDPQIKRVIDDLMRAIEYMHRTIYADLKTLADRTAGPAGSMIFYQEDFLTGTDEGGEFGIGGWQFLAGSTVAYRDGEASHPGIVRVSTGAVSGTTSAFYTRTTTGNTEPFNANDIFDITFIVRLNTNDANTLVRVGLTSSISASPPTNGIYLEKLDADTNWFLVTRTGGVQTRTDSGVAVGTGWLKVRIRRKDASTVAFTLNDGAEQEQSTNLPTTAIKPYVHIINSAAADKTIDVDYFELLITNLDR